MKRLFVIALVLLMSPLLAQAQILKPVHWSYSEQKIGGDQYIIHMKAHIDPGWHIYAQEAGEGPIPTSFNFDKEKDVVFKGKVRGVGDLKKAYDKAFDSKLKFYEDSVDFVQYVEVKGSSAVVKGSLEYMVCDNEQCLPPKRVHFKIPL